MHFLENEHKQTVKVRKDKNDEETLKVKNRSIVCTLNDRHIRQHESKI